MASIVSNSDAPKKLKLKWLNGPLAGRELELPHGEVSIGGTQADIALTLHQDARAALTVDNGGVTVDGDAEVWVNGSPWGGTTALPLGQVIDIAGQGLVLGVVSESLPMIPLPRRRNVVRLGSARARTCWSAGIAALLGGIAMAVLLWPSSPDAPFDVSTWLSQQLKEPMLKDLRVSRDSQGTVVLQGRCESAQALEPLRSNLRSKGLRFQIGRAHV